MKNAKELLAATTVEDPGAPGGLWVVSAAWASKEHIEQTGRHLEAMGGVPFRFGGRPLWAFQYDPRARIGEVAQ